MADFDRARSFIERYVIERASTFRSGFEKEDGHQAAIDGRTIYKNIAHVAKVAEIPDPSFDNQAQQASVQAPPTPQAPPGISVRLWRKATQGGSLHGTKKV